MAIVPQARGEGTHLGLRLLNADTRLEFADNVVVLVIAHLSSVGRERQRQKHLRLLSTLKGRHHLSRQRKRPRQNAHNLLRHPIQVNDLAENAWIGAVASRPHSVTEHGGGSTPRAVIFLEE